MAKFDIKEWQEQAGINDDDVVEADPRLAFDVRNLMNKYSLPQANKFNSDGSFALGMSSKVKVRKPLAEFKRRIRRRRRMRAEYSQDGKGSVYVKDDSLKLDAEEKELAVF